MAFLRDVFALPNRLHRVVSSPHFCHAVCRIVVMAEDTKVCLKHGGGVANNNDDRGGLFGLLEIKFHTVFGLSRFDGGGGGDLKMKSDVINKGVCLSRRAFRYVPKPCLKREAEGSVSACCLSRRQSGKCSSFILNSVGRDGRHGKGDIKFFTDPKKLFVH